VLELGAAAVNVVTVHRPVTIEPVKILVEDSGADFFQAGGGMLAGNAVGEQSVHNDWREQMIPVLGQMDSVEGQRFWCFRKKFERSREKVNEEHTPLFGNFSYRVGVELEVSVLWGAFRQIRLMLGFLRDG